MVNGSFTFASPPPSPSPSLEQLRGSRPGTPHSQSATVAVSTSAASVPSPPRLSPLLLDQRCRPRRLVDLDGSRTHPVDLGSEQASPLRHLTLGKPPLGRAALGRAAPCPFDSVRLLPSRRAIPLEPPLQLLQGATGSHMSHKQRQEERASIRSRPVERTRGWREAAVAERRGCSEGGGAGLCRCSPADRAPNTLSGETEKRKQAGGLELRDTFQPCNTSRHAQPRAARPCVEPATTQGAHSKPTTHLNQPVIAKVQESVGRE
eukprot:1400630-Rhodomonas_salina.1